jgi:hypothetical protein
MSTPKVNHFGHYFVDQFILTIHYKYHKILLTDLLTPSVIKNKFDFNEYEFSLDHVIIVDNLKNSYIYELGQLDDLKYENISKKNVLIYSHPMNSNDMKENEREIKYNIHILQKKTRNIKRISLIFVLPMTPYAKTFGIRKNHTVISQTQHIDHVNITNDYDELSDYNNKLIEQCAKSNAHNNKLLNIITKQDNDYKILLNKYNELVTQNDECKNKQTKLLDKYNELINNNNKIMKKNNKLKHDNAKLIDDYQKSINEYDQLISKSTLLLNKYNLLISENENNVQQYDILSDDHEKSENEKKQLNINLTEFIERHNKLMVQINQRIDDNDKLIDDNNKLIDENKNNISKYGILLSKYEQLEQENNNYIIDIKEIHAASIKKDELVENLTQKINDLQLLINDLSKPEFEKSESEVFIKPYDQLDLKATNKLNTLLKFDEVFKDGLIKAINKRHNIKVDELNKMKTTYDNLLSLKADGIMCDDNIIGSINALKQKIDAYEGFCY